MSELRYFRSKSRDTTGRGGDTEYYLSLQVLWEATTTKTGTTHRKTRESFSPNFFYCSSDLELYLLCCDYDDYSLQCVRQDFAGRDSLFKV